MKSKLLAFLTLAIYCVINPLMAAIVCIGNHADFFAIKNYVGVLQQEQNDQRILVFNENLTAEQVRDLLSLDQVQVYNIPQICIGNYNSQEEIPSIKDRINSQLMNIVSSQEEVVWLDSEELNHSNFNEPKQRTNREKVKFAIVIPSYNNQDWVEWNLTSALTQNYDKFRIIFINDHSQDATLELAKSIVASHHAEDKVLFVDNEIRKGGMANYYCGAYLCEPDEVVLLLDGDDWLASDSVLQTLFDAYKDPSVWITYGQYSQYPSNCPGGAGQLSSYVIANRLYRESSWVTTHLRTFYAGLFHKIDVDDLRKDKEFFAMAWDLGIMFPLLYMAGDHSRFIPEVLYRYNCATPFNDNKVNVGLQLSLEHYIRGLPPYSPVNDYH